MLLLVADDYAMTAGISTGIRTLAMANRLSGASAMVTTPHWPREAPRIAALRDRIAVGLHLNLSLGAPLGAMRTLAPSGVLPDIATLTRRALARAIDREEIAAETRRQIARFRQALGHPPDFLDGHQHVHALPVVREGVIAALAGRDWPERPLVRVPSDRLMGLLRRRRAFGKAAMLAVLAHGLRSTLRGANLPANDTFAGVTGFAAQDVAADFAAALTQQGRFHLVMCHPGHVDEELPRIDPVTDRRQAELDILMGDAALAARIWHPQRSADAGPIDWSREMAA